MKRRITAPDVALAAIVLAHLAVSVVHGRAHAAAQVTLSGAALLFVFVVILIGPVAGLLLRLRLPRSGAWVVAAALAASLVFGVANHFAIEGGDHVSHVAEAWRPLFGITALLLAVTEGLGSSLAVWCAVRERRYL